MRGKWNRQAAGLLGLAVLMFGCGDSHAPPPPDPGAMDNGDGDGDGDGGRAGNQDAGEDASLGTGPRVTVISPASTDDPSSEDVIVTDTLAVRCKATPADGGELIDPQSVEVAIYAGDETMPIITQVASSTSEQDVYQAESVSMADVPHGEIRVECVAADVASMPQTTSASITTLFDKGPAITFLSPMETGYVRPNPLMAEDVRVRFRVAPQPLGDGDPGADVSEISASVGGRPIATLDKSTTEDDVYSFGVDFNDTELFTAIPKTLSVRVDAKNSRTPDPRSSSATLAVGVDTEGPTISVQSPVRLGGQDPVVSGKVDVVLQVKDTLSGVDPSSVEIRIQKKADPAQPNMEPGKDIYRAESQGVDGFVASFETGSYPDLPSLSITLVARDNAANETQSSLSVDVDTVPPWISLEPPTVRERILKMPADQCSAAFDPLGSDAPNDGDFLMSSAFVPRVLIWDRPLTLSDANIPRRYAMIKSDTPRLYIQHNPSVPLLVDSDHDPAHECDSINLSTGDTDKAPVTLVLSPVASTGSALGAGSWVESSPGSFVWVEDLSGDPDVTGYCSASIPAGSYPGPQPLTTGGTDLTRVIHHTVPGADPVVYADSPAPGARVLGKAYPSPISGWACLVATAKDNADNFGFSPPLRICIGTTPCDAGAKPTCTDTCKIPSKFLGTAPDAMPRFLVYN